MYNKDRGWGAMGLLGVNTCERKWEEAGLGHGRSRTVMPAQQSSSQPHRELQTSLCHRGHPLWDGVGAFHTPLFSAIWRKSMKWGSSLQLSTCFQRSWQPEAPYWPHSSEQDLPGRGNLGSTYTCIPQRTSQPTEVFVWNEGRCLGPCWCHWSSKLTDPGKPLPPGLSWYEIIKGHVLLKFPLCAAGSHTLKPTQGFRDLQPLGHTSSAWPCTLSPGIILGLGLPLDLLWRKHAACLLQFPSWEKGLRSQTRSDECGGEKKNNRTSSTWRSSKA